MAKVGFIMNEHNEGQIVEPKVNKICTYIYIYIYISTKTLFTSKVYSVLFIIQYIDTSDTFMSQNTCKNYIVWHPLYFIRNLASTLVLKLSFQKFLKRFIYQFPIADSLDG